MKEGVDGVFVAVRSALAAWQAPVVTDHDLGGMIVAAQAKRQRAATSGAETRSSTARACYQQILDTLLQYGLLMPDDDFRPGTVYRLFGRLDADPASIACAVDPFAHVSHLSALEYHGLTDRFSRMLYLTTPPEREWRVLAGERMARMRGHEQGQGWQQGMPLLRPLLGERVRDLRIEQLRRSNRGGFRSVRGSPLRVSTVGRTFLDTLREPVFCGGIQHVIDIWREHAPRNLGLILDEIEGHGKPVDKVRAGYLLEAVCGLRDPVIDAWIRYAQRGGSRKLDPLSDYAPHFSARWMLSINVPSLMSGGDADGGAAR